MSRNILDLPTVIEIFVLYAWRTGDLKLLLDYDEFFVHLNHMFLE
jgi:hypothetical protein